MPDNLINSGTPALPAGLPATAASSAVWSALVASTDATAAELADHASVGKSTANKVLAALETAGVAVRQPGGRDGGRSLPDRWSAVTSDSTPDAEPSVSAESAGMPDSDCDRAEPAAPAATVNGRLARGQLRDMVVDYLRQHPNQEFSPTALSSVLDRSAGAIANALERLVGEGTATRTSDTPRRYRIGRRGKR